MIYSRGKLVVLKLKRKTREITFAAIFVVLRNQQMSCIGQVFYCDDILVIRSVIW